MGRIIRRSRSGIIKKLGEPRCRFFNFRGPFLGFPLSPSSSSSFLLPLARSSPFPRSLSSSSLHSYLRSRHSPPTEGQGPVPVRPPWSPGGAARPGCRRRRAPRSAPPSAGRPRSRRRRIRRRSTTSPTRSAGRACCRSCSRRSCAASTPAPSAGRRAGTSWSAPACAAGGATPRSRSSARRSSAAGSPSRRRSSRSVRQTPPGRDASW
jgi:hypothetical protein